MSGDGPALLVEPLEEGEVHHPDVVEAALVDGRAAQVQPQLPQHPVHHAPLPRHQQQEVARLGRHGADEAGLLLVGEELGNRRIERAALADAHPHEPRRPELLGPIGEAVKLGPARLPPAGHADALDARGLEGAELGSRQHVGHVDQLHAEADVGLVGAVALVGLLPGDPGDLRRALAGRRLGRVQHRCRDGGDDVVLVGERHLGVELHELELAVGPQVLVAQAAGDLEVAVEAPDHEQLLEQLGALGQGIERARLQPRGDDEVPCPLGCRRDQHRGLDLDEALLLHGAADGAVHHRPHAQVVLHPWAAKVDVAMAQAHGLVGLDAVGDRERRRLGRRQHLDGAVAHLDLACGQVGVLGALGAQPHRALDPQDVLRT